ncbi:MAG TPA: MFS transporter [Acidobacteriaceae bacterium]
MTEPSSSHRRIQVLTVSLLFLAGLVNFLDRSSLSIANSSIRADLHLSGTRMGALLSIFSFSYGLAQLPTGWLLDRFGTRLLLALALCFWSAAQVATGFVRSFGGFVPLRVALGLGEAPFLPGGVKAIHGWFSPQQRGWPMGLLNASTVLGQALAPPLLTGLLLYAGWRTMFLVIGVAGLVLAAAWFPLYRDPPAPGPAASPHSPPPGRWLALFRAPTLWGMILGFSGINYTAWLYLAWLPGYLQIERHLTLARTGWVAAIPFLFGACGMFCSGLVGDALVRRGLPPIASRKTLIVAGMLVSAPCTYLVSSAATTRGAVLLIGMALFFIHFAGTAGWGLVQFAAPPQRVASVGAIQNFGSFMCASAAPILTGWLLDRTHSFALPLALCSAITVLGAVAYLLLVRGPIPADPAPPRTAPAPWPSPT